MMNRWSISEHFTQMSKMPSTIELLIRKHGDLIGRVDLNHPKVLEWRQGHGFFASFNLMMLLYRLFFTMFEES